MFSSFSSRVNDHSFSFIYLTGSKSLNPIPDKHKHNFSSSLPISSLNITNALKFFVKLDEQENTNRYQEYIHNYNRGYSVSSYFQIVTIYV